MKTFVIFGDIEFLDFPNDPTQTAYVYRVRHADFVEEAEIEQMAKSLDNADYIQPHCYNGRITFMQYHKEKVNEF